MSQRDADVSEGGFAPLFDRLTDLQPDERQHEDRPFRVYSRDDLRESIRREVARILNTRSAAAASEMDEREWTVLDYGMPDFSGSYTRAPVAQTQLAVMAVRAIRAFEPRLHDPSVRVLPHPRDEHSLQLVVQGAVRIGRMLEPVSFPLALEKRAGR